MATTKRGCGSCRNLPSNPDGLLEGPDCHQAGLDRLYMGNRLYVGNLSFQATPEAVRSAFESCGTVTEVHIVQDRETGQSRGFGFVTMGSDSEAAKAISTLNGSNLEGRALRVNEAEERQSRGGGGGGGGGYGGGGGGGGRSSGGGGRGRW